LLEIVCLLLLFTLVITSGNSEVSQLVGVLARGNDTQVITQLLLLQVSLGEVLQLPLGELNIGRGSDGELGAVARDGDAIRSEVSGLSINLDAVLEILLESSYVEYLIVHRGGTVDDEFYGSFLCLNLEVVNHGSVRLDFCQRRSTGCASQCRDMERMRDEGIELCSIGTRF